MDIIKLISKYNLSYEILHISDIDNFHNIVKEKHTQAFKAIEFIWPDGFKPIEPERTEKNDRKLIEEKVFKLVYEHINGDLSCIKEYLEPDIGLWEIFNNNKLNTFLSTSLDTKSMAENLKSELKQARLEQDSLSVQKDSLEKKLKYIESKVGEKNFAENDKENAPVKKKRWYRWLWPFGKK